MSDHAEAFIAHLEALKERDSGAMAALRHSMAFEPGAYPKAFPFVERFAGSAAHERDPRRLALYAVAGLFARHPIHRPGNSLGAALGSAMLRRQSPSIESRFVALLGADAENIVEYLRQSISLLAADGIGVDYTKLLDDLSRWMDHRVDPGQLRQRWARDFYRAAQTSSDITNND